MPEAIALGPDAILNAIKTSKLSDGRPFELARVALVESRLAFSEANFDTNGTAEVARGHRPARSVRARNVHSTEPV